MLLTMRGRVVTFPRRPLVMGIVNITDDSFSGDGSLQIERTIKTAQQQVTAGADIIDVGGESARTNRPAIAEAEESAGYCLSFIAFRNVTKEKNRSTASRYFLRCYQSTAGDHEWQMPRSGSAVICSTI